jgi:undecaprenyl-diphosphatase
VATHITYLQAMIIGLVQGITELFPISSLGHAVLLPAWIGGSWHHLVTEESSKESEYLAFIVVLHVATALALLTFFWREWVQIVHGFFRSIARRKIETVYERMAWLIIIATIPAGLTGLALEHALRTLFAKPLAAAVFLTVNGFILLAGERLRRRSVNAKPDDQPETRSAEEIDGGVTATVRPVTAGVIGVAQIGALFAGVSRSGITMVAGLIRGLDHEQAVRFSFLLATPIILAAGVLKIPDFTGPNGAGIRGQALAGAGVAFVAALLTTKFLTRYFERRTLTPFGIYCLIFGVASIAHFSA